MLIPVNPVRRQFKRRACRYEDVLLRPFPFMSGKQAIFSCAREALFYGIHLLGSLPRRIHVPAYCCSSVLLPLRQLKLEICFYDVGEHLEPILDKTGFADGDIFLLIHYFGIPQDTLSSVNQLCQKHNMILVEDCAHVLPAPKAGNTMGSLGVFSIFSLRKQLPVPDGGVLIVNDPHLKEYMKNSLLTRITKLSKRRWLVTNLDSLAFSLGCSSTLSLRDTLRKVFGSTDNVFNARIYEESIPEVSHITVMVLGQTDFETIANIRRKNYLYLTEHLSDIRGVTMPFLTLPNGAVPQAFPILVEDVGSICAFMRKKGIGVGRWPGEEIPDNIPWEEFPGASSWLKTLMLLPLHQELRNIHLEKIIKVLRKAMI